jgi:hypothetical protein
MNKEFREFNNYILNEIIEFRDALKKLLNKK